ncbi:MAG: phosphatase PAP2 family protein [Flexilinea sp.]
MRKLITFDEDLTDKIRIKNEKSNPFRIAAMFSHSGDSWFWCGILFIVWLFSTGTVQKTTAFWGISIAVTAIFIFLLKQIIRRRRPEGAWGEVYRRRDPHSFPSGHAVRAGLIIGLASNTFNPQVTVLFILWAVLMVISRVLTGVHYIFDIIAGVFFGLIIGFCWVQYQPFIYDSLYFLFDRSIWPELISGG